MTGSDAVSPWFPLPEQMTTGFSDPFIRASDPARFADAEAMRDLRFRHNCEIRAIGRA